jgi:hypothetical protein
LTFAAAYWTFMERVLREGAAVNAGKKLPSSSRLSSVLYYGFAICATGGTGAFIWHQSSKLDRDVPPIVAATQPADEADDAAKTIVTFATVPQPAESAPKPAEPQLKPAEAASKTSSQRGEIMIRGRAGTTKGLAPATDLDRTASVYDNVVPPTNPAPTAGAGPTFYVADDPTRAAREAQSRRDEELRQEQKRRADSDPMWQKRVTQK